MRVWKERARVSETFEKEMDEIDEMEAINAKG